LPREETYRYVQHRLRIAGLPGALPFTRSALGKIHQYSHGIPRVINLVCDRALMAGYSNRVREITPTLVTSAVRNLEGGRHGRNRYTRTWSSGGKLRRAAVVAGALTVLGAGGAAATVSNCGRSPAPSSDARAHGHTCPDARAQCGRAGFERQPDGVRARGTRAASPTGRARRSRRHPACGFFAGGFHGCPQRPDRREVEQPRSRGPATAHGSTA